MELLDHLKTVLIEAVPPLIIEQKKRIIESQERRGEWSDLTKPYARRKEKEVGFVYPMLKASGDLMDSFVVNVSDEGTKLTFYVGNLVSYFENVDSLRNISEFSQENLDELSEKIDIIVESAIQEYYNV